MNLHGIDIPERILNAIRDNKLVVFAGAGASMGDPTNLPSFKNLIKEFSRGTFLGNKISEKRSEDQYLGELENDNVLIHKKIAQKFGDENLRPNSYHRALVNLFGRRNKLRIITTNYDRMFEKVCEEIGYKTNVYTNPALPYGNDFEGIIHIHGVVDDPKNIVITDKDFGKVYMYHSNISKFLLDLFNSDYVILFVGYSYNDLIMRYFTRAIGDMAYDRRFIFIEEKLVETVSVLGITPILYPNDRHEVPYLAIEQVVDFVNRDALSWERRINEISNVNPSFIDKRTEDELGHIVKDIHLLDKFLKNVNSLGWLIYFNYKGYLKKLFSEDKFTDFEYILGKWLIVNFLKNDFEEFKYLCVKNNFSLNIQFQKMIIDEFNSIDFEKISEILAFIDIENMDKKLLLEILDRISPTKLYHYRYRIIKGLLKFKYEFRKLSNFLEENIKNKDIEIRAYTILNKEEMLNLWKSLDLAKDFKVRLAKYMTSQILELYAKRDLGKVDINFANYLVFTDGNFKTQMDIYIWIVSEIMLDEYESFKGWIEENISSEFDIIRRLTNYIIIRKNECNSLNFVLDEKIARTNLEKIEFNNLLSKYGVSGVCEFDLDEIEVDRSLGVRYTKEDIEKDLDNVEVIAKYTDINGSRDTLLKDISEICLDDIGFFIRLANNLLENDLIESDIWAFALKGLSSNEELDKYFEDILQILSNEKMLQIQTYSISLFIKRMIENYDLEITDNIVNSILELLIKLWDYGENFSSVDENAWNEMTFSSSYGVIANSLLKIIQKTSEQSGKLSLKDKELLEMLLETQGASDAKFVIIGNFSLLYTMDKKWATNKLLGYFDQVNEDFRISWRGFLTFSRLYPEIAILMQDRFENAISRIDDIEFKGKFRDKFIKAYTFLMLNAQSDPIDNYIPRVFALGEEDILSFYKELNSNIEIMTFEAKEDISKSWVEEFIFNRANNIPNRLRSFEIPEILKLILNSNVNLNAWKILPRMKNVSFDFIKKYDFDTNMENISKIALDIFTYITNNFVFDKSKTPDEEVLSVIGKATRQMKKYAEIPSDLLYNFKIFDIKIND